MKKTVLLIFVLGALPAISQAQDIESMRRVLDGMYDEMVPLASRLITMARALAGFAAMWYIASRIWGHIARAEPIDVYPLLRPFAIGLAIMLFPMVLALVNGLMDPVVEATAEMTGSTYEAIERHIDQTNAHDMNIRPPGSHTQDEYTYPEDSEDVSAMERLATSIFTLNLGNIVHQVVAWLLQILFYAAALCINTLRTFQLIVLSILGPIVFGLSVFDGFHHTLKAWFARYINVSLWLPVANIFGAIIARIQLNMMQMDADFMSSIGYLVFMVIAIMGYFTVPNVASFIVQPGGRDALLGKSSSIAKQGAQASAKVAATIAKSTL